MPKAKSFVSVVVFALLTLGAQAAERETWFGAVRLHAGMPRAEAVESLRAAFELVPDPSPGTGFSILSRGDREVIGAVQFDKRDKLEVVTRMWNSATGSEATSFGDALLAVLARAAQNGEVVAKITTRPIAHERAVSIRTVQIEFVSREVILVRESFRNGSGRITIQENVRLQ